ncbi:amino acid permease [Candidatus Woesearchaeota archaeon]|nr:amino acid permease [Candidatus Woesearchaeota archaeon]
MAELKRVLGFWTVLALAISTIMGTGMFFGASIGASYAGNASILSWIILTVFAVYISMFFGELVAMFPTAGGVYEYSKQAYSRFISFMMGWTAWIVGNLTVALLVVAAVDYLIPDPSQMFLKLGICIAFIIILNIIAFLGIEASGLILMLFAGVSVTVLLSVILPGIFHMQLSNLTPFFNYGYLPVFVTIFFIAESFFGWESVTYLAEETKNPEKIIPQALILGTVITGVLGILTVTVSLGIIPWKVLIGFNAPLSAVFERIFGSGMEILNFGVFFALIGSAAGGIISMPRLILALARDKLFITQLSDIHPKFHTPHKAIIFQTIISLVILGMAFGRYKILLSLLLPLGIIMYIFTIFAVTVLRFKMPNVKRAFKVPFGKIGSIVVILFMVALTAVWIFFEPNGLYILTLSISFIFVGLPIYLLLVLYYDPDAIVKMNNSMAYLTLLTERFVLPKRVRDEIFKLLGDVKGKIILEFGCSVGTLTMQLAKKVMPRGKVYATDLSENDLIITKKRLIRKGHMHVTVIYDKHQVNRVHPDIPHVDSILSMGMMGYLQDVKKVLKEMRDLLPYGGKIVFVDYADFFKVIPNVAWLSDDKKIEKIFRECGFSVYVTRKKGLLWNYIYVYGIKFHEDVVYV